MSFSGMWCLVPVHADTVVHYTTELAPAVEAQATLPESRDFWTTETRRRAELLLTAALHSEGNQEDIDALLDGVPPIWRAAARAGQGLLGAHVIPRPRQPSEPYLPRTDDTRLGPAAPAGPTAPTHRTLETR
ncbi:hypothetical protein [Kitasatospora sp. NPDC015120]|uniref:hypothetical protein n=1 Tax=Kitasatospora sp. NPDC015120 TaxID=3364023 RepID=UPI0036F4A765